jgi:hypothetical protein
MKTYLDAIEELDQNGYISERTLSQLSPEDYARIAERAGIA